MPSVQAALTEKDLIKGCLRNERRMQQLLYQHYCVALLSIARAYVSCEEDAVEVLQDSFLKIFQQIGRFDEAKSTLYTWMRTIVVRTTIDRLRKNKAVPQTMEWTESYEPLIEAEVLECMTARQIVQWLGALPETTRVVFTLFTTEGYSHREIGEALRINEGTSRWHLSEARKYLVNAMKTNKRA